MERTLGILGLTERESRALRSLLQEGPLTAAQLASHAHIPQPRVYSLVDGLRAKGLVTALHGTRAIRFQAISIASLTKRIEAVVREDTQSLARLPPAQNASAHLYAGRDAVLDAWKTRVEMTPSGRVLRVFGLSTIEKDALLQLFLANLSARRVARGHVIRVLLPSADSSPEPHTKLQVKYTNATYVSGITVVEDTVLIVTWGTSPTLLVFENAAVAAKYTKLFDTLWNTAS